MSAIVLQGARGTYHVADRTGERPLCGSRARIVWSFDHRSGDPYVPDCDRCTAFLEVELDECLELADEMRRRFAVQAFARSLGQDPVGVLESLLERYRAENSLLELEDEQAARSRFESLERVSDVERRMLDALCWLRTRIHGRELDSLGWGDRVSIRYHDGRGELFSHGMVESTESDRFTGAVTAVHVRHDGRTVTFRDADRPLASVRAVDAHRSRKGLK
jgi:hypothetical protein